MSGALVWLFDTLVYTGLLIALVLLLRRPVARWFGAQLAYALWCLPLLRLLLPPITLPAALAPAGAVGPPPAAMPVSVSALPAPSAAEAVAAPVGFDWTAFAMQWAVILWLGGAALFLLCRGYGYWRMRRRLLADAVPVGEAGRVRLVETPAVSAPVAFGVADKVIALPPRFMAKADIHSRDMALAHELAHHRGHDLVANIAAQPLLALHWFNPLAWWGWRAMRCDQEAACDARVVAGRARAERAAYAQVIAGFAIGEDVSLAASMACPVLGEKSIIHRLRSLTMHDIPTSRRRVGTAALVTTALALPLTATISFAKADPTALPRAETPVAVVAAPDTAEPVSLVGQQDGPQVRTASDMSAEERAEVAEELAQVSSELAEVPTDLTEVHAELVAELERLGPELTAILDQIGPDLAAAMLQAQEQSLQSGQNVTIEVCWDEEGAGATDDREAQTSRICNSAVMRGDLINTEEGLEQAVLALRDMGALNGSIAEALRRAQEALREARAEVES